MKLVLLLAAIALAKKPKPAPEPAPVVVPAAAVAEVRTVTTAADVTGASGVRAGVTGTLQRKRPEGASEDATAVVLDDGTAIYLSQGEPPEGWAWMLGTKIRVMGTLWATGPEGAVAPWTVPFLAEPDPPMPGDMPAMVP